MSQGIEIPVSLGLQSAKSQIEEMRQMLQKSVKVDSSAFKDIQRFLDKISGQADGLKGKMGEAFKTSSGSKRFLDEYEQLIGMLEAAREKFTTLSVNDIAFSPEDAQTITDYKNKIQELQTEITNLQKGKIGTIFDGDTIANADKVREVISQLKLDANTLTFDKLSSSISSELSKVDAQVEKTTEKLKSLQTQSNAMTGQKFAELSTQIQGAVDKAIDPKSRQFKNERQGQYQDALKEFYEQYSFYGGKTNFNTTGSVSKYLQNESKSIGAWASDALGDIKKAEDVIKQLETLKKTAKADDPEHNTKEAKRQAADNLMASLGLDIDPSTIEQGKNYRQYIDNVIGTIKKSLESEYGASSSEGFTGIRDKMLEDFQHIFDNLDLEQHIDPNKLKSSVGHILENIGIDSTAIGNITKNITKDMNPADAFQVIIDQIDQYKKKIQEDSTATEEQLQKLTEAQKLFSEAQTATGQGQSNVDAEIDNKKAKIDDLVNSIQQMVDAYNQANGTNLKVNLSALDEGKSKVESFIQSLTKLEGKQKALGNIQMAVNRWMGFWQVLNMGKKAINDMKTHIQELDQVMTKIAVVTNMDQSDLWGQIGKYSEMARQYGVAIKGVYEVSQIYYQQGLQSNDVMTLTQETLKMARIAGIEYGTAADYMTTAIRGFKMEMQDAAHVTDVFSALAASTASSTEELATAISKTAASAANVGSSFEATSAMMATMIATTRESATNIGTALKSIISRYGEMKENPEGKDSEGEEYSLNKVDKALQTIGVSIHTATGEFRDFDEVILELGEKWDQLDSVSQRYIATIMAGNRQQSRFLALVSNVDEYKKALETAQNSEGAGELQTLKTLDSIDAKIEKMKVTIQEFYTSSGMENLYKSILDTITNIISAANSLPKAFQKFPAQALAIGMSVISSIKAVLQLLIASVSAGIEVMKNNTTSVLDGLITSFSEKGRQMGEAVKEGIEEGAQGAGENIGASLGKRAATLGLTYLGAGLTALGSVKTIAGMSAYGASTTSKEDQQAAQRTGAGGILGILGSAASGAATGTMIAPGWGTAIGAAAGALKGIVSNFATLKSAADMYNVTLAREIELSDKRLDAAKTEEIKAKETSKNLEDAYTKLTELSEHQYDSVDAMKEYTDYMNQLGENYPEFIQSIGNSGDILINMTSLEEALAEARANTAAKTVAAIKEEQTGVELRKKSAEKLKNLNLTQITDETGSIYDILGKEVWETAGKNENKSIKWINDSSRQSLVRAWLEAKGWTSKDEIWGTRYNKISQNNDAGAAEANQILTQYSSQILKWAKENYGETRNTSLANNLKSKVEDYITEQGDTQILSYLGLDSTSDILGLNFGELFDLSKKIQKYGTDVYNSARQTLSTIGDTLSRAEITETVQNRLNALRDQGPTEKENSQTLQKYLSLMTFIYSGMGDTLPSEKDMKDFENWILNNKSDADKLLNLDYSQYRTSEDILKDFETLPEKYSKGLENQFNTIRENAISGLDSQIEKLGSSIDAEKISSLFSTKEGEENKELITQLIPSLRSGLTQYSSLLKNGLPAIAENYYKGLETFYTSIGELNGSQQLMVSSVIQSLDLSDSESVQEAADKLIEMGPEFKTAADNLLDVAARFPVNASLILQQVIESVQETTAAIETAFDKQTKGVKRSEAMKSAKEILDKYTGEDKGSLTWESLYDYSEELGGWVENENALRIRIASAKEESNKEIEKAQKRVDHESQFINAVGHRDLMDKYSWVGRDAEKTKELFKIETGFSGTELDQAWAEWQQIVTEFYEQVDTGEKNFEKFLNDKISNNQSNLQKMIDSNANIDQDVAKDYLKTSINYKAIAGGTAGKGTKKNLLNALRSAIKKGARIDQDDFEHAYAALLAGNFEEWNSFLKQIDLSDVSISESTGGEMIQSEVSQYSNAINEILSKKPYSALSESTQALVGSQEEYQNADVIAKAREYAQHIQELYNEGKASIEDVNNAFDSVTKAIADASEKSFKESNAGKQKELLESFKDGFTDTEAAQLKLLDDNGKLKEEFAQYLERDTSTGNYVKKAGQNAASVIQALAQILGIAIDTTTDQYKDTIKADVDKQIEEANKKDKGKQRTSILSSIFSAKAGDRINIFDADKTTKTYLQEVGLISDINQEWLYVQSEEQLNNAINQLDSYLNNESWVSHNSQTATLFRQLVSDFREKTSKGSAFEGVIGETVTKSAAQSLSMALQYTSDLGKTKELMKELQFDFDEDAQVWKANSQSIQATMARIEAARSSGQIDTKTYNELIANLNETERSIDIQAQQNDALVAILSDYTNISEGAIAAFKTSFSTNAAFQNIDWDQLFKSNGIGGYNLDFDTLLDLMNNSGIEFNQAVWDSIASITDNYTEFVSKASQYVTNGTSSMTEMESFMTSFREATGDLSISTDQAFKYDSQKKLWKLDSNILYRYAYARGQQLGMIDDELQQYVSDLISQNLRDSIDISGFYDSDRSQKKMQELQDQITDYYKNLFEADYYKTVNLIEVSKEELNERFFDGKNNIIGSVSASSTMASRMSEIREEILAEKMAAAEEEYIAKVTEAVTADLEALASGGAKAVEAYKRLKPDATEAELEKAYRSQIELYETAASSLASVVPGSFVTGKLAEVLESIDMAANGVVLQDTFDMVEAYNTIYEQMSVTAGATMAGLNSVYAKMMTASDQKNMDITDALSNASGMTYDALGEILARQNILLEDVLGDSIKMATAGIEKTGFGKIRITDWNKFAASIFGTENLESIKNTPEYISAFKAYNDSLIQLNKQAEKTILEEAKSVMQAGRGDWVNVTQLQSQLDSIVDDNTNDSINNLKTVLDNYGASLEDGILKIRDEANLLGIAQTLQDIIQTAGLEIEGGLEEIADAVAEVLRSYAEIINKGIEGGLSNVERQQLITKAQDLGVTNLHFTQTIDGFKLAQSSAIELYRTIAAIDNIQGQIVFDKLSESLKESNENFATTDALLNHIVSLREELSNADSNISTARRAEYEAELQVAQEIAAVRSADYDESWNFMSNKIPAAQNNPLNYMKNLKQAFNAIQDAYKVGKNHKKGFMGYEDFYNIINEFNNMAGLLNKPITIGHKLNGDALQLKGDLTSMSDAIMEGLDTLTTVDTGDAMINIGALGITLAKSGGDLEKGVNEGIKAISDAEVATLDGLISMLELIVAMESLGDVAGEDMTIELGEIVITGANGKEFAPDYKAWLTTIEEYYQNNKDFQEVAKGIVVDNMKFMDWIKRNPDDWVEADASFLNALYQAGISTNWNTDEMGSSLQQMLNSGKFGEINKPFSITLNDRTFVISHGILIEAADWSDKDVNAALQQYISTSGKKEDEAKQEIITQIQSVLEGKGAVNEVPIETVYTIHYSTVIKQDQQGRSYVVDSQGNKHYSNEQQYKDTVGAMLLREQAGITNKSKIKGTTADVDYGINTTIHMQATANVDKGTVTWTLTDFSKIEDLKGFSVPNNVTSQDQLLEQMYNYVADNKGDSFRQQFPEKEAWIYQTFGVHMKIKTEVLKDGAIVENPAEDPKVRQSIKAAQEKALSALKKYEGKDLSEILEGKGKTTLEKMITLTADGKVTLKTDDGYEVQLDWDSISRDQKFDSKLFGEVLSSSTGFDQALSEVISSGVKDAFSALPDALKQVPEAINSIDTSKITDLATGLKTAADNAKELSENLSNLTTSTSIGDEGGVKGLEIEMPDLSANILAMGSKAMRTLNVIMNNLVARSKNATGSITDHFRTLSTDVQTAISNIETEVNKLQEHVSLTWEINAISKTSELLNALINGDWSGEGSGHEQRMDITAETTKAEQKAEQFKQMIKNIPPIELKLNLDESETSNIVSQVEGEVKPTITANTILEGETLSKLKTLIESVKPKINVTINTPSTSPITDVLASGFETNVRLNPILGGLPGAIASFFGGSGATGTLGLAKAQGTLMGELGPELVVSNGRYFVAGQNGPEMVNLDNDAIVFNHLQTKSLLEKGMSNGRGKAVTNERNAVSFAKGNVNGGPAMASASAALAALKQLRSMWKALGDMSVKDLAGKGGGGGGGGGDEKEAQFLKDLEKWYNWLQRIAQLEKEINYEEALRSRIASDFAPSGQAYYESQVRNYEDLKEQAAVMKDLAESQQAYFEQRRAQMNSASNPFSALYTFDEYGQLKYKNGQLEYLSKLVGRDALTGKANMSAEDQYNLLVKRGYGKFMQYDSSGNKIEKEDGKEQDFYTQAVEAFWDKIDSDREEMQSLHDSIEEQRVGYEQKLQAINDIIKEIEDNQIKVEDNVLKAMEDARKREIDELKDTKEAIQKGNDALIDGLNNQLDKERQMYESQENKNELTRLERQLSILQRSGASAAQINDIQKQIAEKNRDAYFDKQEEQIQAIQDASDAQLERLDREIELMEETLEYEKAHGLLWNQVYEIMAKSPQEIASYIYENDSSYWSQSPAKNAQTMRQVLFEAEQWSAYKGSVEALEKSAKEIEAIMRGEKVNESANLKKASEEGKAAAASSGSASSSSGSGSNGSGSKAGSPSGSNKNNKNTETPKKLNIINYKFEQLNANKHKKIPIYSNGSTGNPNPEDHTFDRYGKCIKCGYQKPIRDEQKQKDLHQLEDNLLKYMPANMSGNDKQALINRILPSHASGGYVKNPTLSTLAENGEEAVLNAEQTKILRDNILSNKPSSLISLLKSYNQSYGNTQSFWNKIESDRNEMTNLNNGTNVTIEHAEVNVQVDKLANNYDAARAGNDIMKEILNIANKTQAKNRVGR